MLEPKDNPNPKWKSNPPGIVRHLIKHLADHLTNPSKIRAARKKHEAKRIKAGLPHVVEYFHQFDDPYSHLSAQVLQTFADRYDIKLVPHLIRASGGDNQPEFEKLARWARRDAELIAPYFGLDFPANAAMRPSDASVRAGQRAVATLSPAMFVRAISDVSKAVWRDAPVPGDTMFDDIRVNALVEKGSQRLAELKHYSGAMFYYGGEWYWGIDRLFHLERRLRALGACKTPSLPLICPRPEIDTAGVDASDLELDFFPSLNSPYTAAIYDKTIETAEACGIKLNHRPVLPMVMRGVPLSKEKAFYIVADTKREAEDLGVPFGPVMSPIGDPVHRVYSLFPWARTQGKEIALLSSALHTAFGRGVGLHTKSGLQAAVERAGLSWEEAQKHLDKPDYKAEVAASQEEMIEKIGLWGVPSYRLRGGGADIAVWGQDRLWLIAAKIKERAAAAQQTPAPEAEPAE